MTRNLNKANRLKEMEKLLAWRAFRVAELAERFGVTRRTIERDLWDLREVADLIEEDGRYRLPAPSSALNEVEALAVHSATRLLVHTGVGDRHYRNALQKLAMQLPEPARSTLARSVDRLGSTRQDRTLDLVAQAWFNARVLRCEYRSASSPRYYPHEYEVYYYELNRRNLQPYVVARERLYHKSVGVFRLSRMRHARLLDETYEIPADFDPVEYLEGAWGITVVGEPVEVLLKVDASVAPWFVERQEIDRNVEVVSQEEDGSLRVVLRGRLAKNGEAHELLAFILGWGSKVEALEPASIRERIAAEARASLGRYS